MKRILFILWAVISCLCVQAQTHNKANAQKAYASEQSVATQYARTTARLNMRNRPSKSGTKLMTIPDGTVVQVIQRGTQWSEVKYAGKSGFVFNKYLDFSYTPPVTKNITYNTATHSGWWVLVFVLGVVLNVCGLVNPIWACLGLAMQVGYLLLHNEPLFMLCPSIVGWGWVILLALPVVLIAIMVVSIWVHTIIMAFEESGEEKVWACIAAILAVGAIITLVYTIFAQYMDLIIAAILVGIASVGGTSYVGTFIDRSGHKYDVFG